MTRGGGKKKKRYFLPHYSEVPRGREPILGRREIHDWDEEIAEGGFFCGIFYTTTVVEIGIHRAAFILGGKRRRLAIFPGLTKLYDLLFFPLAFSIGGLKMK